MMSTWSVITLVHLVGLALGVGAATVKLVLLLKCKADPGFIPTFLRVSKTITRQIMVGLVLLVLSGVGWLLLGYQFTSLLAVKVALVAAIFVLGPVIDNVVEPKYRSLAPAVGTAPTASFVSVQRRYLALESVATLLFYVIIVIWVQR